MTTHEHVRNLLYEYLRSELGDQERVMVERHLEICDRCREACGELRAVLDVLPGPENAPSAELSEEYWTEFSRGIVDAIPVHEEELKRSAPAGRGFAPPFSALRRRLVPVLGSVLLLIGGMYLAWLVWFTPGHQPEGMHRDIPAAAVTIAEDRFDQYLRKSKVLLVGMTNMPATVDEADFDPERKLSNELIREGRYLRRVPLDARSAILIAEMDKVLIPIANARHTWYPADVELLKRGILRENLLFKIRIAENLRDSSFIMHALNDN